MTDVDLRHRWNLAEIFPSPEAWTEARTSFDGRLHEIERFPGTLGGGAATLRACLDRVFSLYRELRPIIGYAAMSSDDDTRDAAALERRQVAAVLGTALEERISFLEPEILALGGSCIASYQAEDPLLAPYAHFLDNVLRRREHTLGQEAEKVLAGAGLMTETPEELYSILTTADIPWPTIRLADGSETVLDHAAYTRHRSSGTRSDRKLVFDTFWGTWQQYERSLGVTLYSQLKCDLFRSRARGYRCCLAAALDESKVPEEVYLALIRSSTDNLPTLHRYLRLQARLCEIEDPQYHDVYCSLVERELSFPVDHGQDLLLDALAPLGAAYADAVREGFAHRWMDVYPRPGKRPGAYSHGSLYDLHPFVLMSYNDDYESVSTLAHEWGHAIHSLLANTTQPFPTADYPIFIAEIASTFNEALLLEHMLTTARSDSERLFYLGSALDGLRATFFRQSMFAEFELATHERVEQGEALSGQRFSELYGELLRRYHGHDLGVMRIDPAYWIEWAFVPHFYYGFYVYQYATSLAAASLFAEQVLTGDDGARERYLDVLRAGGAGYPYELLCQAGVDLATARPYEALIARMNRIMDQIEAITRP
jgi:oligoendopeptidase F